MKLEFEEEWEKLFEESDSEWMQPLVKKNTGGFLVAFRKIMKKKERLSDG